LRELSLNHTPAMFTSLSECVHSGGVGCTNAKKSPNWTSCLWCPIGGALVEYNKDKTPNIFGVIFNLTCIIFNFSVYFMCRHRPEPFRGCWCRGEPS